MNNRIFKHLSYYLGSYALYCTDKNQLQKFEKEMSPSTNFRFPPKFHSSIVFASDFRDHHQILLLKLSHLNELNAQIRLILEVKFDDDLLGVMTSSINKESYQSKRC